MDRVDRDPVVVSTDGISVSKSLERNEDEACLVVFEIQSNRTETATFKLVDTIPPDIDQEDIGFHPEFNGDQWEIASDGTAIYEQELAPSDDIRTLYGIRNCSVEELGSISEPTIELNPEVTQERPSSISRPEADYEASGIQDTEAEETSTTESGNNPLDYEVHTPMKNPDPASETAADGSGPHDTAVEESQDPAPLAQTEDSADEEDSPTNTNSVAHRLANELRANEIGRRDLQVLTEEFNNANGDIYARIQDLQQKVSDFSAYTTALESFLEENGTGVQLIEDLQDEIMSQKSTINELTDDIDGLQEEVSSQETGITELTNEVDQMGSSIDDLEGKFEEFESDIEELRSQQSEIDELDESLKSVTDDVSELRKEVEGVDEVYEELESDIEELRSQQSEIDELDESLTSVADDVSELRSDLEEVSAFRNQLESAFGNQSDEQ